MLAVVKDKVEVLRIYIYMNNFFDVNTEIT